MKYIINTLKLSSPETTLTYVTVKRAEDFAQTFEAVVGTSVYDAFLEQAKLTDKQVKALKPDTWYDFPEGE